MNPRFLIISALAVSIFATSLPVFAGKKTSQYETMTEGQNEDLLQTEIFNRLEGGMNSGGGNSIQGRVIESYRINYKNLKGYSFTNSVLERLNAYLPDFANALKKSSDKKVWLLVPAEFSTIPKEISGIPAHTEQTALNRPFIVWISKPNLKAKSNEEAGILVLHEMVMNYLRGQSIKQTEELITKTQVITSRLLDMEKYQDTELAKIVNDLSYSKYNAVSTKNALAERDRILGKFLKERESLCKQYRIETLREQFSQKKLSPQEEANYLQGLRSITKLELKLSYPSYENDSNDAFFQELISVARKNKIYKSELEGIRLSDKFENEVFVVAFREFTNKMSWVCRNGCVSEEADYLRNQFASPQATGAGDICHDNQSKKPDQYGW
jgi:hypothetical protein